MTVRSGAGLLVAAMLAALCATAPPARAGAPTVGTAPPTATSTGPTSPAPTGTGATVAATPELVRQVQFLLSSIGIDPGPIDGVPRQLTNAAVHRFENREGLPVADLVENGQISTDFLNRLRKTASTVLLGAQPPAAPAAVPQPAAAAPPPPPPNRFAACPYTAADFLIGGTQYTPDSFLATGFAGSVKTAVSSLKDRLKEAQQVAQQIGGPALREVQRQARVLAYFECRLKIEESGAATH